MSMNLRNKIGAEFDCSLQFYCRALELAQLNEWEPEGTTLPKWILERYGWQDWDGGYFTNDYQLVSETDAANLAQAIERGLNDIPDEAVCTLPESQCVKLVASNGVVVEGVTLGAYQDWDIISYWSGNKQRLHEFIDFCKAGAYETW